MAELNRYKSNSSERPDPISIKSDRPDQSPQAVGEIVVDQFCAKLSCKKVMDYTNENFESNFLWNSF